MRQTLFFPRRLNAADAGFFFLGQRPDTNVAMVMIGILEREIPFDAMLDELTAAAEDVPRFKDFLSRAPLDMTPPVWTPKEGFKVREQIHRLCLEAATWEDVVSAIDRFQAAALPPDAPPWEVLLVDGLPDNRALLAMKVHHALSDGMALSMLFAKAFGGDFLARSGVEVIAKSEEPPRAPPLRIALSGWTSAARSLLGRTARSLPELYRSPARRRHELDAFRRHLRRRARPQVDRYSPERRLCGFQVNTEAWSEEARSRGGSPNDLYLALVARTMRLHFADWDLDSMPLQIVMPVDVRTEAGVQHGGNVTGVGVVELGGSPDDLRDLSEVREQSRRVQEAVIGASPSLLDEMVQLLPGRARAAIQFREFSARDLVATNVPMPISGELCGVPFQMMFMVAPPIGAAVGFSLTSYENHFYLAANADAVVAGGSVEASLAAALGEVFDEPPKSLRGGTMGTRPVQGRA